METRRRPPAGTHRPGLTLPELLLALVGLGALGLLLLLHQPSAHPFASLPGSSARSPLLSPEPSAGNLLINGSFEVSSNRLWQSGTSFGCRSMPGWQISGGTVDVLSSGYWEPAPGQGRHSLDLVGTPGAATIEQTFPTEPGRQYCFSGWLAHNPEKQNVCDARAQVFLNGERFAELYHYDANAHNRRMGWKPFTYRFRAPGARTTLTITDVSGHGDRWGTALDGLVVTEANR
jgi:hypothetical protein